MKFLNIFKYNYLSEFSVLLTSHPCQKIAQNGVYFQTNVYYIKKWPIFNFLRSIWIWSNLKTPVTPCIYTYISVSYRVWRMLYNKFVWWNCWNAQWICVYLHIIQLWYAKNITRWIGIYAFCIVLFSFYIWIKKVF